MSKSKQDNDVIDRTGTVYTKNYSKLSWPFGSSVAYYKD